MTTAHDSLTDLIHVEAELLDERRYEQWADLFTDDCRYWAPYDWHAEEPRSSLNLIYDDRDRLGDRVSRLTGGDIHSQDPASHTTRLIGGIRQPSDEGGWSPEAPWDAVLTAAFRLTELRRDHLTEHSGRYRWWFRSTADGPRIVGKKVQLLGASRPLSNLTFPL